MSAQGYPWGFNERRGKIHTTGQATADLKKLCSGTVNWLPLIIQHKSELKVKTEQDIQRI